MKTVHCNPPRLAPQPAAFITIEFTEEEAIALCMMHGKTEAHSKNVGPTNDKFFNLLDDNGFGTTNQKYAEFAKELEQPARLRNV